ncbi:conserved hypothetical protein [Candidatus Sulfotelmatomonas gaucii]|uniref:TIGR03435 family protein n=1 Tax=Candidatus Sulfuritelmatomonas gaucii TaxID=2043161 RepID=A0A2N9M725_9BACT|nr:conserved hypothetical protein [Candidatus Sulfotelmatomonas gaucii]
MLQECSTSLRLPWLWKLRRFHAAFLECAVPSIFIFWFSLALHANAQQTAPATPAATLSRFEVATIKPSNPDDSNHRWERLPGRFVIENYSLQQMIRVAFGLTSDLQVVGGPKWVDDREFDIEAKADDPELAKMRAMTDDQRDIEWNHLLQSLLTERFGLKVRVGEQELPVYALVVAKSGVKLKHSPVGETAHGIPVRSSPRLATTVMTATTVSMVEFTDHLSRMPESDNRLVVDRTGLEGQYDFELKWTRDYGSGIPENALYPGLFTALQEQLGLELKPDKAPVKVVIVDAATEPGVD